MSGITVTKFAEKKLDEVKHLLPGPEEFTETWYGKKKSTVDWRRFINDNEISPLRLGTLVDYMTRLSLGIVPEEAFRLPMKGAAFADMNNLQFTAPPYLFEKGMSHVEYAQKLTAQAADWRDDPTAAISAANILCSVYEQHYRTGKWMSRDKHTNQFPVMRKISDKTCSSICDLINNGHKFLIENGPVMTIGEAFQARLADKNDFPDKDFINPIHGDLDFTTFYGLWDFKCSNSPLTRKDGQRDYSYGYILQIIIYWILGISSINARQRFLNMGTIGIYNPKLNVSWSFPTDQLKERIGPIFDTLFHKGQDWMCVTEQCAANGSDSQHGIINRERQECPCGKGWIYKPVVKDINKGNTPPLILCPECRRKYYFIPDLYDQKALEGGCLLKKTWYLGEKENQPQAVPPKFPYAMERSWQEKIVHSRKKETLENMVLKLHNASSFQKAKNLVGKKNLGILQEVAREIGSKSVKKLAGALQTIIDDYDSIKPTADLSERDRKRMYNEYKKEQKRRGNSIHFHLLSLDERNSSFNRIC